MAKKPTHTPKGKNGSRGAVVKNASSKGKKKSVKPLEIKKETKVQPQDSSKGKGAQKQAKKAKVSQPKPSSGEKVGYGQPPRHSQFKPGVSGNPKGRPKGTKNVMTIVHEIGSERVKFKHGDQDKEMTMIEALVYKSFLRAINEGKIDLVKFLSSEYDRSVNSIETQAKLDALKRMDDEAIFGKYFGNMFG